MRYVHIENGVVGQIISEYNPKFEGIPISQRYSPEFLAQCITVTDAVEVRSGMLYQDGFFTEPPKIEEVTTYDIPNQDSAGDQ